MQILGEEMTLQISHESIMIFPLMPENANDRRATVLQQGAGRKVDQFGVKSYLIFCVCLTRSLEQKLNFWLDYQNLVNIV